jgi:guanylate kinase
MFESNKFIVVITAPSGAGKTTVIGQLLARRDDFRYSVSATTRPARDGEQDGRDYFFMDRVEFEAGIERGDFAEWAEVHGNFYGTLKSQINDILDGGSYVVMDVDIQGARSLRNAYPDGVYIHLLPPSMNVLRQRLAKRGTEDEQTLSRRLENAVGEIRAMDESQYVVVNDELEHTCSSIESIVEAESRRIGRMDDIQARLDEYLANGDSV